MYRSCSPYINQNKLNNFRATFLYDIYVKRVTNEKQTSKQKQNKLFLEIKILGTNLIFTRSVAKYVLEWNVNHKKKKKWKK